MKYIFSTAILVLLVFRTPQAECMSSCKDLYEMTQLYEGKNFEDSLRINLLNKNLNADMLESNYTTIKNFTKNEEEKSFLTALAKTLESDSGFIKLSKKKRKKQINEILYSALSCRE